MDFKFENVDEDFRSEIKDFVEKELPWNWREEDLDPEDEKDSVLVRDFKRKLGDQGWLTMAWPKEYGGQAASHMRQVVFNEEMAYRGISAGDAGIRMVGPILMLYGTDEQKEQFLPKIASSKQGLLRMETTLLSVVQRYGIQHMQILIGCSCWFELNRMPRNTGE